MIPGAAGREHAELGPWGGRRLRALPSPQPESGGAAGGGGVRDTERGGGLPLASGSRAGHRGRAKAWADAPPTTTRKAGGGGG